MSMVTIKEIKTALEELEIESGDKGIKYIEDAIANLCTAKEALNTISVRGRSAVDTLLGCMMGIDMIIGDEEETDGR